MKIEMKNCKNEADKKPISAVISNCSFTGVKWDCDVLVAINNVALGLKNLTELFRSQNIKIDSMIKVSGEKVEEKK